MEMRHLEKVARALLSLAEPPLLLHLSVVLSARRPAAAALHGEDCSSIVNRSQ